MAKVNFSKMFFDKGRLVEPDAIQNTKPRIRLPRIFFDRENFEAYETIFSNVMIIDAHTHIGRDRDGHGVDEHNFIRQMKMSHINKAVVFPLNEPNDINFSKSNDRVHNFYKNFPKYIIPFFRLNPGKKWKKECQKRLLQGFMGIKLHPRSQDFGIASRQVMKIYEKAEKNRLPVLIHTGFGLDNIAHDIKKVVDTFPKLRLILGHSAFVDFEATIKVAGKRDNVLFDTSTLRVFSLMNLLNSLDHTKIVFGSDVPYYDFDLALEMLVDTAIICNKNPNQIRAILGGNIMKWFK
ncbi:amidohydrolase family protein [Candidatus Woesearchaeota archaeon]|nr:amidohydrolase family protein [Candidatus Woesearchaeota archaeon]